MSLQRLKIKPGDQVTFTDENGIEHRNATVLKVNRSKVTVRNSYGYPVEVSRRLLRAPTHGDATMVTGLPRISTGPKPKTRGKIFHVR
jgi:hypothetical protein